MNLYRSKIKYRNRRICIAFQGGAAAKEIMVKTGLSYSRVMQILSKRAPRLRENKILVYEDLAQIKDGPLTLRAINEMARL